MGYNPGDLGIVRVDPITHKPYSTTAKGAKSIVGILGDVGLTEKTPGFDKLEKALLDRSAHAGGTGGIKIPELLATKTPEEAELSKSWLEVEKARSDQAVKMTSKLKSWQKEVQGGKFNNIDDAVTELTRRVEREPILDLGKGSPHDIEQKGIIRQLKRESNLNKAKIQSQSRVATKLPGNIATVTRPGEVVYKGPGIGLKDVAGVIGKKSRLARLFIPSAASAVAAPFTIADAKARTAKAEATGHWLDKTQAKLAQTEAAADVTGVVPNPVSEVAGFGAGISNILIDSGRLLKTEVKNNHKTQRKLCNFKLIVIN